MKKNIKNTEGQVSILAVEKELIDIKKLLALLILKAGAQQDEVGAALGIDQNNVSRMFQGIKIRKFNESKKE